MCIKKSLVSLLRDQSLRSAVEARVVALSKATHRGGLMLDAIIKRYIGIHERGEGSPTLPSIFHPGGGSDTTQAFFSRLLKGDREDPHIGLCMDEDGFHGIPAPQRFLYGPEQYDTAAKTIQTTTRNIVVYAFRKRQERFVKHWCFQTRQAQGTWRTVIKRINGWGVQENLSQEAEEFAVEQRRWLEFPEEINNDWLERHPGLVFIAYSRWLAALKVWNAKQFQITPGFKIKSHHLKIDTRALHSILKNLGKDGGSEGDFMGDDEGLAGWRKWMKVDGLTTKKWGFDRMIETDGTRCSIHFWRWRTKREKALDDRKAEERRKRKKEGAERKEARKDEPEGAKRELQENRRRGKKKKSESGGSRGEGCQGLERTRIGRNPCWRRGH
jgi:hypothetical protein